MAQPPYFRICLMQKFYRIYEQVDLMKGVYVGESPNSELKLMFGITVGGAF